MPMRVHDVTRDHVVPAADDEGSFLRNFENLLQTVSCTDSPKSLIRMSTPQRHVVALLLLKGNVKEHMFSITVSQNSEGLNEFQLLFYKAHCPGMIEFLGVHANDHHVVWDVPFDVDTVSRSIDYLQFRLYDVPGASFFSLFCSVPGRPRFYAAAHYITRVVGRILMLGDFHMSQIYPSMITATDSYSDHLPNTDDEFFFLIRFQRLIRQSTRNLRLLRLFTPQHHCVGLILQSNGPANGLILTMYSTQNDDDGRNELDLMVYETPPAFFESIGVSPTEHRHVKYIPVKVDTISGARDDLEVRYTNAPDANFVLLTCNPRGRNEFDSAAHYMKLVITRILGLAEEYWQL